MPTSRPVNSEANPKSNSVTGSEPASWAALVEGVQTGDESAVELSSVDAPEPAGVSMGSHTDAAVLAHAFETFGSREKANHWLRRPNRVFQGRTPLEAVASDPEAVEIELTRIDDGVYI
jgi:hypothetical protein